MTELLLDALQRQLPDFYGTATLTSEGLQIYSTLDLRLQRAAARALAEELERFEKGYPKLAPKGESRLEGCVIALRPQTGEVLALVGGRDYAKSQFDRCTQARRPAGSVSGHLLARDPQPGHAAFERGGFQAETFGRAARAANTPVRAFQNLPNVVDLERFLTHLVADVGLSAQSQHQAAAAVVFMYRELFGQDFGGRHRLPRAKQPKMLPKYATPGEVAAVLTRLDGVPRLAAMIMYGSGTRIAETIALRIKDVSLETRELYVRGGKGAKDRKNAKKE